MLPEVTLQDDLVAWAHKSCMRTSRSHVQPWQRGISQLLGVKTTGVTQYKQNGHVPNAYSHCCAITAYTRQLLVCVRMCAHVWGVGRWGECSSWSTHTQIHPRYYFICYVCFHVCGTSNLTLDFIAPPQLLVVRLTQYGAWNICF